MAEFLWTFTVQEVLKKALLLAAEQILLAWGLEKELSKLSNSLRMAEAILGGVDRNARDPHSAVVVWVDELQDIILKADDLLDELAYEKLRINVLKSYSKMRKVHLFSSASINNFLFRRSMAKKMMDITQKLSDHYTKASPLGLVGVESSKEIVKFESDLKQTRETISGDLDAYAVVGRESEVSNIVKMVIDANNQQGMSILPIVGMGGLGKTTMAKLIFNHEKIKAHFDDKTIWVCVSEPFVIDEILASILESLKGSTLHKRENIVKKLQELLKGKRYFLVLDDVWNENPYLWNELKGCLLEITQNSENFILVTTRSARVAEIMETLPSHHLQKLSDDQCWSLFIASANGYTIAMTPMLDVFRKEFIRKFGGIPLAARVLGGAVKFEGNYERWVTTLVNVTRVELDENNLVLSVLKLSVDHLPSLLKQCFAYCSNFPKDFLLNKEELIQMWMAQEFVQLEDEGDKCFNILLSRSLFQDVVKDDRGRTISCKMHDLIHEIACATSSPHQGLQMSPIDDDEKRRRKLRTIIYNNRDEMADLNKSETRLLFDKTIEEYVCLRVLIVDSMSIHNLPDSIGNMKHLRYLNVSHTSIKKLPKSFVHLYNLQTLKLGYLIENLPKDFRKLISLKHLQIPGSNMKQMPPHLSQMTQLHMLSKFIAGFEEGCKIEEMGPLSNLKGSLVLSQLENVKTKEQAIAANLAGKENLREMLFQWGHEGTDRTIAENDGFEVLEGLQPHNNLELLCIKYFPGKLVPNSIFVENLTDVQLVQCTKCERLPMLGQIPNLERLHISRLHGVKCIGIEFYGNDLNSRVIFFPKLKELKLIAMFSLEQWEELSNNNKKFPCLQSLVIQECLNLRSIPNHFGVFEKDYLEVDDDINNVMSFTSHQGIGNLRHLTILRCEKLLKLPVGLESCSSIQKLVLVGCLDLNLNLKNMHSLSDLSIGMIRKFPEGLEYLSNFKTLHIFGIVPRGISNDIVGSDMVIAFSKLPQQIENFVSLRHLQIESYDMETLPEWLGNLICLEELILNFCKYLKHLPSKKSMLRLTKLRFLHVHECPKLQLEEGEIEREKVSHVPRIKLTSLRLD